MKKKTKSKERTNRYAALTTPQAKLDFHQFGPITAQEVKKKTEAFIAASQKQGLSRIAIITGKGLHSKGRPVVKPQVERCLKALEANGSIDNYHSEKITAGGDGAFIVIL